MKRRKKIKLISFGAAVFLCLFLWGATRTAKASKYEAEVKTANQKALIALNEYMDNIETALIKSMYASSDDALSNLTALLLKDSSGAKESLSALSSGETQLYNTYKFLSQVGEYMASLHRKSVRGEKITPEDRETLKKLQGFASGLSRHFDYMSRLLSDQYLSFEDLDEAIAMAEKGSESMVSYMDSVGKAEEALTDFPTLLYDGPFSDNILTKESKLLSSAKEISVGEAKKIAAECLETEEKFLVEDISSSGRTACYNFCTDTFCISITKKGGYPLVILSSPSVGEEKLTGADAVEKAALFLYKLGFKDMTASYYSSSDGICTVNFAYKQGPFICYPDLIKVSLTLDNGKISGLETTDFIMNHIERKMPDFGVSPEEAAADIAPGLNVKKISAAVIPTPSGGEKFTYELFCVAQNGQHILIYKNIETGREEDILLLLYADNGALTK